jgi:hypothetical protein
MKKYLVMLTMLVSACTNGTQYGAVDTSLQPHTGTWTVQDSASIKEYKAVYLGDQQVNVYSSSVTCSVYKIGPLCYAYPRSSGIGSVEPIVIVMNENNAIVCVLHAIATSTMPKELQETIAGKHIVVQTTKDVQTIVVTNGTTTTVYVYKQGVVLLKNTHDGKETYQLLRYN